jgi:hypothetical protein
MPENEWPELGHDALDPARAPDVARRPWLPRRRPALGVRSTAAPTVMFVAAGAVLGPYGAGVLSPALLDRFDIVISVALAIIGVFVGLGMTSIPADGTRVAFIGGGIAAAITIVTMTGGLFLLVTSWGMRLPMTALEFAVLVGLCSSASAAVHAPIGADADVRRAAYLADVDDVPLVVLGAWAIAVVGAAEDGSLAQRLLLTVAAGAATGVAGWLLFDRAEGAAERAVFVTGAVLLIAGVGVYLGTSPLLSGCIAAVVWVRAPGAADRITAADLGALQHPMVSLLLIFAGALIEWNAVVLWVAGSVVILRLLGKLLASVAVAPMARVSPALLATVLLPPGVMGIALALNARQVVGSDIGGIVAVVTIAAGTSELVAAFLPLSSEEAR